jgi:hypothetical protein
MMSHRIFSSLLHSKSVRSKSVRYLSCLLTTITAGTGFLQPPIATAQSITQSITQSTAQSANSGNSNTVILDKKSSVPMFESVTISPKATAQKFIMHGLSGGPFTSQSISLRPKTETGDCIGFVDRQPDHRLTLTEPLGYLQLLVRSSGDTVLIVRGPGGVWCNDDSGNRNPGIAGRWLAGTYEIWIGSYEEYASFPYLLELSTENTTERRRNSSVRGR